jgi:hypothetical protein
MEIGTVNFDDLFDFSPEPQPSLVDAADAHENAAFARLQSTSAPSGGGGKNYYTLQTQTQQQQQQRLQEQPHQQQQHQLYQGPSGSDQRAQQQQQQQMSQYSNSYCTSTPQRKQVRERQKSLHQKSHKKYGFSTFLRMTILKTIFYTFDHRILFSIQYNVTSNTVN